MRPAALSLLALLALAGCKDESSGATSASGTTANGSAQTPAKPLTPADVEKYLEFLPDLKATDPTGWASVAAAHGLTLAELKSVMVRVTVAYTSLAIHGGVGKAVGVDAENVEVVRPFAERIRAAKPTPR